MKLFLVSIFLAVFFPLVAEAQPIGHYQLSVFGTRNGLLSPKIYALAQTVDHCLWIGTEIGASRYNGYGFQNLQYTTAQEQIGKIVAITQDSAGGVWLGGEAGLFCYANGELIRCTFLKNYLPAVESLVTDKEGALLIGEMHGLYKLPAAQLKEWKAAKGGINLQRLAGIDQRITCMDVDGDDNLYFGSFDGVAVLKKNGVAASLLWKNKVPANLVRFVTALSGDSVFFNQYDGESSAVIRGAVRVYKEANSVGQRFFKRRGTVFRLTTSTVERYDNGTFLPFINFAQQTNFAFTALCDAEENFWLGTWEGLLKYRYSPFAVFHRSESDHPETFSFLETRDGKLLFGGNRGRIAYKKGNAVLPLNDIQPVFHLSEVMAMYEHSNGSFWAGSGYEGITRFYNGQYKNFREGAGLPDNHCNTFYPVDEHTLFGCTEKGVVVLDPAAPNPVKAHYGFAKAYNRQPKLLGVFEPQKGTFLFYSNGGLFRLKDGLLQTEAINGLTAQNLYITCIAKDEKGRIWMATQGKGLLQCRYANDHLVVERQYTKKDGLLSDEALSLLLDKKNRLWVADYTGLSLRREESDKTTFVNFTEQEGLPSEYYQQLQLAQQRSGTIWAVNSMNIFSFHPDSVLLNSVPPKLFFDSVSSPGQTVKDFTVSNTMQLSHRQANLSFAFTAVSLSEPAKIKYAYRLLPGDTTWDQTGERSLRFSSLTPGTYTLQIKASNNSGLWSEPIGYSFQISPPFWNAWWFYLLLSFTAIGLFYFLFRRRLKAVKDKAAVRQQIAELESRALRAQMNPHFIFNCLNAIQELIVTENVTAAYDYLSKFSKLLRLVLNHSEQSLISLADELAMLELYLQLESLRFRQSFSYNIIVAENLDADAVLVPPLLLQPFIENAVWHGLMLKEGEKHLLLSIEQQGGEIICVIEDNGIGRQKSAEIKAAKLGARHFESKGLTLSRQRIQLLEGEEKRSGIKFEDLYNGGNAAGTRVSVHLPFTQK